MPSIYHTELDNMLQLQIPSLIEKLQKTSLEESSGIFDSFMMNNKATVFLREPNGRLILPPSTVITENSADKNIATAEEQSIVTGNNDNATNINYDSSKAKEYPVLFTDMKEEYTLIVMGEMKSVNQVTVTLIKLFPVTIISILCISLLVSFIYSQYITKPIVKISSQAGKMANMELELRCRENRNDEIGTLAKSLNNMAANLSKTLEELQTANSSLKKDIDYEREMDKQRMMFFSAVSHELKTPITALQGQLEGMLQNIGNYQDRDKYLEKSLAVTKAMEHIIQEIVTISRLDTSDFSLSIEELDMSEMIREVAAEYFELIEQKQLHLEIDIPDKLITKADKKLITKVVSNLFSNAICYSPIDENINVSLLACSDGTQFTIHNTGVSICNEALPHLFDAFYRADQSRSRKTGGSGLGLYIVKRILEQHDANFNIRNVNSGVEFSFTL